MDAVQRMINRLQAGAGSYACSGYLAGLDGLHLVEIYTYLIHERLKRKYKDIEKIHFELGQNWNQTFYTILLRYLGAPSNSKAFETLARTVSYSIVTKNSRDKYDLEALLIGASGLLDIYKNDEYTIDLKRRYEYLAHKHNIAKMSPSQWKITNIYPHNHPVLRMAQAAAFISQANFHIDTLLECAQPADVERMFDVETSDYWIEHFVPSVQSSNVAKRIGSAKSDILAINVVAMMQYVYGSYMKKDYLCDRALDILETVRPENNFKVRRWSAGGVRLKSAFETQALIQLGDEYCDKQRCTECPVGRKIIKSVERSCNIE